MASGVGRPMDSGSIVVPPCEYSRHACKRPRHGDYKYCTQHLLEDGKSSFTCCEYISRTSKRKCPNPARRQKVSSSLPSFCDEHIRDLKVKERYQKLKRKMKRKKKNAKHQLNAQNESKRLKLVNQLMKYSDEPDAGASTSRMYEEELNRDESEEVEIHRPITDDWLLQTSEDLKNNADWDDFDPVNNEVYEPLRYADVLTPEEVVATAQSKLIRLQSLYIEQFKRLFHLMKEKRRQYLHEKRREDREEKAGKGGELYATLDPSYNEDEIYALSRYRKRSGIQELLRKKQKKRRLEAAAGTSSAMAEVSPSQPRCAHASNHIRCKSVCLPYTKFCSSHILNDPHQLLYKKCRVENCETPICLLTAMSYVAVQQDDGREAEECYCIMHAPLPEMSLKIPQERGESPDIKMETEGPEQSSENAQAEVSVGNLACESASSKDVDMEVDLAFGAEAQPEEKAVFVKTEVQQDSSAFSVSQPSVCEPGEEVRDVVKPEPMDTLTAERNKIASMSEDKTLQHVADGAAGAVPLGSLIDNESAAQEKLEGHDHSASAYPPQTGSVPATSTPNTDTQAPRDAMGEGIVANHAPSYQPSSQPVTDPAPANQIDPTASDELGPKVAPLEMQFKGVEDPLSVASVNSASSVGEASTTVSQTDVISSLAEAQAAKSAVSSSGDKEASAVQVLGKTMNLENSKKQEDDVDACETLPVFHSAKGYGDLPLDAASLPVSQRAVDRPSTQSAPRSKSAPAKPGSSGDGSDGLNANNNSSKEKVIAGLSMVGGVTEQMPPTLPVLPPFRRQSSYPGRGERKPSSADEEVAVVSLLSLCSGHRSDDNSHSSSTEQE